MEQNEIELIGTEKQVKWARDIIERIETFRNVLKPSFIEFMDENIALPKNAEIAADLSAAKENGLALMESFTESADAKHYIDKYGWFLKDYASARRVFTDVYSNSNVEYTQVEKFTKIGLTQASKKVLHTVLVEFDDMYDPDYDRKTGKWKK